MNRVFKFRLSPTKTQKASIDGILARCCELYNACLEERRDAYKKQGKSISRYDQQAQITWVRHNIEGFSIYSDVLLDIADRVNKTYQAFFRRIKNKQKSGCPRFKSKRQYNSFTFTHANKNGGVKIVSGGKRLRVSGVGNIKIKIHRQIEGKVKRITIKRDSTGHYWACFICVDVPMNELPKTNRSIGIDLGLTSFIATSDGELVENPKYLKQARIELERAHRKVTKKKRGSKRQKKARRVLAKKHLHIYNARRNWQFNLADELIRRYDTIYIEDLETQNLVKNNKLSKSITDAAWASFIQILTDKAESAGRLVVKVDPKNTSQGCSQCGELVPKTLKDRIHNCPHCGYTADRDVNAARNVFNRGLALSLQGDAAVVEAHLRSVKRKSNRK